MTQVLKVFTITFLVGIASCSIGGLTYRDPYPALKPSQGDDPCNPLYWYPKHIPDYCNDPKSMPVPVPVPKPIPMPPPPPAMIPMPMPMPPPLPMPAPMMMPMPACGPPMPPCGPPMPPCDPPMPGYGPPMPAYYGSPMPAYGPLMPAYGSPMPAYGPPISAYGPPMPFGPPAYPSIPAPYLRPAAQSGFVPGVEGLVTHDGGINILPFSDVYSDYIEKHKQKMIRIRLQELLDKYEKFPKGSHRKSRNHKKHYE